MKKIIVLMLIIYWQCYNLEAQPNQRIRIKYLKADTLLALFESGITPFEILDRLFVINETDYKGIYEEPKLKPYLLRWLDRKEYAQFKLDKEKREILADSNLIKRDIKDFFAYKAKDLKAVYDSISSNSDLFKKYKDSVVYQYQKGVTKRYKTSPPYPPEEAIDFLARVPYPEAYEMIKKWWVGGGKQDNYFYAALLKMGDPEARNIYNQEIKEFVEANGRSYDLMSIYSNTYYIQGGYTIEKFLELLSVDINFVMLSEGDDGEPFNCKIVKYLIEDIFSNQIPVAPEVRYHSSCEERFKYIDKIKLAAQGLIIKHNEDNLYWMKNMPFYKDK